LNQYGQPYDPYNTYATYGKDQILPQSYVMSYPQVGYPVLVPATGDVTNTQQAYAQLSQQHLTGILTQRADSQQQFDQQTAYYQKTSGSPTMNSSEPSTTNTATNATSTATTAGATSTTTTSPATENIAPTATPEEQIITAVAAAVKAPMIKEEHTSEKDGMQIKKEESAGSNNVTEGGQGHGEKPQPITPMPSTSNSSGTSSPSDTHEEDQSSKFSGLTQLCSAALDQNKSPSS
jgi:hypothetical protein